MPEEIPETQCSVGNPIGTAAGVKTQKETDVYPFGEDQIKFERTYNNATENNHQVWRHSYAKELRVLDPNKMEGIRLNGWISFASKAEACTEGWEFIRVNDPQSQRGDTAQYVNGKCQVWRNGSIVKNLAVVINEVSETNPPSAVLLVRENGSAVSFISDDNTLFRSLNGTYGELHRVSEGEIAWRYYATSGEIEDYSLEGKLKTITARGGMKQELVYDVTTGLLNSVRDATGRELSFSYSNNRLVSVTVDGDKTSSYTYNASGLITIVTRPDNTQRIYHYEDTRFPTYLTGITDERGVRYATWTYDAQGRAISSEHAGGTDKTLLAFNADGSTTVTNPLGKQTTYHFDDIAGARRVTQVEGHATASCEGANQNYTYTPEGWLASKTDWKGNATTYSYNTFGQEISRTEASGTPDARTITTEWHPDFYVKTRVVEGGKETLYTYDDNGRLLSTTTNPLPIQ